MKPKFRITQRKILDDMTEYSIQKKVLFFFWMPYLVYLRQVQFSHQWYPSYFDEGLFKREIRKTYPDAEFESRIL